MRGVKEALLSEWQSARVGVEKLGVELRERLVRLLEAERVPFHSVMVRVKDAASLATKLARPDKSYEQLWDVTDLLGLRVETYFEDHVERVARLVEAHFKVDFQHSGDRARPAGYRSVHYVCSAEGGPHPAFRFEVQLRTVLQHAWAEVEHDLGYKADDAVPEEIRRRFARVASLLEIADQEFVSIRRDLATSRDRAKAVLERRDGVLPIDLVSLEVLTRRGEIRALDEHLARSLGKRVGETSFFPGYLVEVLRLCGLTTTDEVMKAVEQYGGAVEKVIAGYAAAVKFDVARLEEIERGYGLLLVAHLAVARGAELGLSKVARLTRLYQAVEFPNDEKAAAAVATSLVRALA